MDFSIPVRDDVHIHLAMFIVMVLEVGGFVFFSAVQAWQLDQISFS